MRGALLIWLDKEMTRRVPLDSSPGWTAVLPDAATGFCLTIKVLFMLPLLLVSEISLGLASLF